MISPDLAFISIGSNINPEKYLPLAVEELLVLGSILNTSRVYQNAAIDRPDQPDFLNVAILLETHLQPLEIREVLRKIEKKLDRVRTKDKFAARTIDLDLSLLGKKIFLSPDFSLPDPDILKRAHISIPLSECAPDFLHPTTCLPLAAIAEGHKPDANLEYREDMTLLIKGVARVSN
jgi:2-amino-4-hydroxy-6-hydroxymethyldihydropteridine diphosphokinase